jgi:hypothetical protein
MAALVQMEVLGLVDQKVGSGMADLQLEPADLQLEL